MILLNFGILYITYEPIADIKNTANAILEINLLKICKYNNSSKNTYQSTINR